MPLSPSASARLATQLDSLQSVLAEAAPEAMRRRPASGKWSAHENLAHLARYHEVFLERLRRILNEHEPPLGRYRAEDDPQWPVWAALSTSEVLARLNTLRAELVETLNRLSPSELSRVGVHPVFGKMALSLWVEFFLLHEGHHLYVVFQRVREGG